MLRPRILAISVAAIAAAVALLTFWSVRAFYNDDAFISLRYAHNLLAGNGLVWNPGEPVEGYSNFLFVLIVAALGRMGIDLVLATKLIGVASYLVLLAGGILFLKREVSNTSDNSLLFALPLVLVVCSPCLIAWSLGGLETVLFATLIAGGTALAVRSMETMGTPEGHRRQGRALLLTSLLFALATLTRFEGLLFFGIAAAVVLYTRRNDSGQRHSWFELLLPYAVLVGAHLIFRLWYYGALVPNTWHVKGLFGWERLWLGWLYLLDFILAPPYPVVMVLAATLYCRIKRRWSAPFTLVSLLMLASAAVTVYAGGDHMPAFRLCAPIVPLASLFLYLFLRDSSPGNLPSRRLGLIGLVLGACTMALIYPGLGYRYARSTDDAAYVGRIVGEHIATHWPSGSLIALNSAGATPYYAPNQRFIDMLGLNDRTIAHRPHVPFVSPYQLVPGHAKGDGRYVFSRQSNFIIAGPSNGCDLYHALTLSEYELARIVEFRDQYELVRDSIPTTGYPHFREFEDTKSGWLTFTYYRRLAN